MRTLVTLTAIGTILTAGTLARAQERQEQTEITPTETEEHEEHEAAERAADERHWELRKGWELSGHVGIGGFTDMSSTAFQDLPQAQDRLWWPGASAQIMLGHRFAHWISLGTLVSANHFPRNDLPPGATGGVAASLHHGAYARFYFGRLLGSRTFDPWVSGAFTWSATFWTDHDMPSGDVRTRVSNVSIPLSVGLNYNLTSRIGVSVMGQVTPWIPWERCSNTSGGPTICTDVDLEPNVHLFGGAGVSVLLPD